MTAILLPSSRSARCHDCNSLAAIRVTKAQGVIATGALSTPRYKEEEKEKEKEQSSVRQPRLTAPPRNLRSPPTVYPVLNRPSFPTTIYSRQ